MIIRMKSKEEIQNNPLIKKTETNYIICGNHNASIGIDIYNKWIGVMFRSTPSPQKYDSQAEDGTWRQDRVYFPDYFVSVFMDIIER